MYPCMAIKIKVTTFPAHVFYFIITLGVTTINILLGQSQMSTVNDSLCTFFIGLLKSLFAYMYSFYPCILSHVSLASNKLDFFHLVPGLSSLVIYTA